MIVFKIGLKNGLVYLSSKLIFYLFLKIPQIIKNQLFFLNFVKNNNLSIINSNKIFHVELIVNDKPLKLFLRELSSDVSVFCQIFINREYGFITNILPPQTNNNIILVDLGANIGLTTAFFKCIYNNIVSYCYEPEPENYIQLKKNIESNKFNDIHCYNSGVWDSETQLNCSFARGDKQFWSVRLFKDKNIEKNIIYVNTLKNILSTIDRSIIDVLKIDVEGAESVIFKFGENYNYLKKVKIILIEIHDGFDCRARIKNILEGNNFILSDEGEFTVGINKVFLVN